MSSSRQSWDRIPDEMKDLRQWAVCGPEYNAVAPKRPYNPLTKRPASPTDPSTWVAFKDAAAFGATAIGFMLSADDPYFVIDLDTYRSQVPQNHEHILAAVETYAERSLSGEGAHVLGRGSVGQGRNSRVHAMEIYDRDRFIIMTGNRINDFGITDAQLWADFILEKLGPTIDVADDDRRDPTVSNEDDTDLIARIERGQNANRFALLNSGNVRLENGNDGEGHLRPQFDALAYPSQSEADIALIEILCFYSPDDEQVRRLFLSSALGQRKKAQRRDYVARSTKRARSLIASNHAPPLDFSDFIARNHPPANGPEKSRSAAAKRPGVIMTRVSDVEPVEIKWIWVGRIAEGKVVVVAGHPGLGKSQFTAYLAAKVTTGGTWPNEDGFAPIGAVLMLSCEDDIADTIRPRLEAAGADVSKVHVIEGVLSARGDRRVFHVKNDMAQLEAALDQIANVKLVMIDPISAYMDGSDSHNTGDVRAALAPLQEMAMRRGVAVVVVSHLNKSGGNGRSVNAVTGSGAFVAASRGTFLVEKDADDPDRRLLLQIKNNLANAPGLAFRIRERKLPNGILAPYLEFEAGTVDITADEALSQPSSAGRGESAIDDAMTFIVSHLRGGPMLAREMHDLAQAEGFSPSTLRKAREKLGVINRKRTGQNGGWEWSLPLSGPLSNMPQGAPPE